MEFKPDVPLLIMRRADLSYNEKSFLLWCWICRDSDERCELIANFSGCKLKERSIQWYADYFGVPRQTMSDVFVKLRKKGILKTEDKGKVKEITYVNFKVFG